MLMSRRRRVVVIGSGVAGLTTALLLSKSSKYDITVAAKHMPGDYDIEFSSPWAGADFLPVSQKGTVEAEWDRTTWTHLSKLASDFPEAGIHFQQTCVYNRQKDVDSPNPKFPLDPWWKDLFPDFEIISKADLPNGIHNGFRFTSVCINTAIYLPWLVSQCLKAGVSFKRAVFRHISEAFEAHSSGQRADLAINCTGLSSLKLGGVEDKSMVPVRGQIAIVRNNPGGNFSLSSSDDGPEESVYFMTRAAGGGTVLGGCSQEGNWESQVDPSLAIRIMNRCVAICPDLASNGGGIETLDVIRHGVGLRPKRRGGVRLESEQIDGNAVVHNYGHAGFGYQCSYGCALKAVDLVEAVFQV